MGQTQAKSSLPARPHAAALREGPARPLKPQVWAKPSRPPHAAQASAPLRCPRPGNACGPGSPKLGHSLSQSPGALKCSADSRALGTRGPGPAHERARCPSRHNPGRGCRRIPAAGTQRPYSPRPAGVRKEDREGLWEKESRVASTTSGSPGGGWRGRARGGKRRGCDVSGARREGKASGPRARDLERRALCARLPAARPRLLRANECGRDLRLRSNSSEETGPWSPGGGEQGGEGSRSSLFPPRSVIRPALPDPVFPAGGPEMTDAAAALEGLRSGRAGSREGRPRCPDGGASRGWLGGEAAISRSGTWARGEERGRAEACTRSVWKSKSPVCN